MQSTLDYFIQICLALGANGGNELAFVKKFFEVAVPQSSYLQNDALKWPFGKRSNMLLFCCVFVCFLNYVCFDLLNAAWLFLVTAVKKST